MTDFSEIATRLAAETSSGGLDREIAIATKELHVDPEDGKLYRIMDDGGWMKSGQDPDQLVRPYTRSVDVTLALIAKVAPLYRVALNEHGGGGPLGEPWKAKLHHRRTITRTQEAFAATPAMALCKVLMKALQS